MNVWSMSDSSEQPSTSLQGRSCKRITGVAGAVSLKMFQRVGCQLYRSKKVQLIKCCQYYVNNEPGGNSLCMGPFFTSFHQVYQWIQQNQVLFHNIIFSIYHFSNTWHKGITAQKTQLWWLPYFKQVNVKFLKYYSQYMHSVMKLNFKKVLQDIYQIIVCETYL